ncbi:hypothetical protein [Actinoplanes palleronii]|uniref:hypothetical protein n=1 Tax=Actinoplanes palleronii TaxID=113570 RepID=UPI0019407AD7|nr:hypothetical protein [Actinoplanes palleronii]
MSIDGWRRWRSVAGAVAIVAMLVAVLMINGGYFDPSSGVWTSVGVGDPAYDSRTDGSRTVVTVEAITTLRLSAGRTVPFPRQAAKIAWRDYRGWIDVLEVTSGTKGSPPTRQSWRRDELERAFGSRPDGLDEGREPPGPPTGAGGGMYRNTTVTTVREAEERLRELFTGLGEDELQVASVTPQVKGRSPCAGGAFDAYVVLDLTLPGTRDAEAALPGVAEYLAAAGLDVATGDLDAGLPSVDASFTDGAGVSAVAAGGGEPDPQHLHFGATSGCLRA